MTPADLLSRYPDLWHDATRHPFLDGIRDGTLPQAAFDCWLAQDYLFVEALVRAQAAILGAAPRRDLALLAGGLVALVDELTWFEARAAERSIELSRPAHATCTAYAAFLHSLSREPYAAQITALWAVERAYLEAWTAAAPGVAPYREFVEHWTTAAFHEYVRGLEAAAAGTLQGADAAGLDAAADAFRQVAHHEAAFWQMAFEG